MNLDNNIWPTLEGGYRITYDASVPLAQLKSTSDPIQIEAVFAELWENLNHQGDVGLASYLSLPHIVSACIEKKSLDWNYVGLCVVIEHARHSAHNPELPDEYKAEYVDALKRLEDYLLSNFKSITDPVTLRLTLSLLATVNGQTGLGRAIENLDEDVIEEFLEQF